MLDAGHSKDSGAVGPTGFAEKDANLLIARQLKSILESRGAEVLMTRTGNEDVPLVNRPDTILKENVDLSVSIHNNALPDGINPFKNNGTSAYYYFPKAVRWPRRFIRGCFLPRNYPITASIMAIWPSPESITARRF
jgi:N-acetylmuramoyl-L-alanine amidase